MGRTIVFFLLLSLPVLSAQDAVTIRVTATSLATAQPIRTDLDGDDLNDSFHGRTGQFQSWESNAGRIYLAFGSADVVGAGFQWTASSAPSAVNEYYLEKSGGGDPRCSSFRPPPCVLHPYRLFDGGTEYELGEAGSLADHEWDFGDNDGLGYNTVYFADATGDPDVSGVDIGIARAIWRIRQPTASNVEDSPEWRVLANGSTVFNLNGVRVYGTGLSPPNNKLTVLTLR